MFLIYKRHKRKRSKTDVSWKKHKKEALNLVNKLINEICKQHDFKYNRISIRNQKTRWGSCSSKKNLNFNYKIIYLPKELAEYLVVHELCHLKEMNHSKKYWDLVSQIIPEYKKYIKNIKNFDLNKL